MNDHQTDEPASSDDGDTADPEPENSAPGSEQTDEVADDGTETETYVDADLSSRLWLKAIVPILQLTPSEPPPSDRVQFALDRMTIAACERAVRILGADQDSLTSQR